MKRLSFLLILAMSVTFAMAQNGRTLYDFEDSSMGSWTTIDADGDGYTWVMGSAIGGIYLVEDASLSGSGHNASTDMVCSGSYSNVVGVLTPDNYFVSPQVQLGGSISFWACGQDAGYVAEHFGVAVSTTNSTNASAFTTIQEWTLGSKSGGAPTNYTRSGNRDQGVWQQFTVDLSAYSGQGYIAIRHFNCTDQFILNVDDITITEGSGGGGTTPEGAITFENQQIPSSWSNDASYPWTIASPTSYPGYNGSYCLMSSNAGVGSSTSTIEATVNFVQNGSISFLAGCWGEGSNDSYDWDKCRFYIDGELMFDYGAHQSWEQMSYEVSAGEHTFTWTYKKDSSVNPTGDFFAIDDVTFVGAGNGGGGGSAMYDFEDSTTQGWTTIDADGDGYTWVLGSAIGGIYLVDGASLAGSGHNSSNDLMCSGSYRNTSSSGGEVLTPDNYLVSPQVTLGGSISFYACGQDASYAAEHFGVAVSTTSNSSASAFTTIQEWTLSAKSVGAPTQYTRSGNRAQGTWYQFTVDLSAYSGQGYIAIRHFNCSDQFILDIDDIDISEGSGGSSGGGSAMYDFEDSTTQGWTTIDADGDGYTFVLGSAIGGVYLVDGASLAGTGHSTNDMMCSGSFTNVDLDGDGYGDVLYPDN